MVFSRTRLRIYRILEIIYLDKLYIRVDTYMSFKNSIKTILVRETAFRRSLSNSTLISKYLYYVIYLNRVFQRTIVGLFLDSNIVTPPFNTFTPPFNIVILLFIPPIY